MTIAPGSRYEDADKQFTTQHFYDVYGHPLLENQDGTLRFVTAAVEATYLMHTLPLPPPPPAEYFAKETEHMAFLAYKFMQDSTRWWEIAEANPDVWYPLDMKMGQYLRVPV